MSDQHADHVVPREVRLDACGRQILAPGFRQYLPCDKGCGFLIGCGDAIESLWHESCEERLIDGSNAP